MRRQLHETWDCPKPGARSWRGPATVDDGSAKATYRRGVLRIELPKQAAAQARRERVDSV